jgi:hypothetical protein
MLFGSNGKLETTSVTEGSLTIEDQALILEAAMLDCLSPDELQAFVENHTEVQAALRDEVLLEKTIVRLDKQAKLNRAQKTAVFTVAKERNDPLFKKLITVWRLERYLEGTLLKKYGNEGMRRARTAMSKPAKSKSPSVKKVANRIKNQLNAANGPRPTELGHL